MAEIQEPQSRDEVLAALEAVHRDASELFASIPEGDFFRRPEPEVWSPGENVIHLIQSVKAVADAMKMPKIALRGLFGTAGTSKRYGEVRDLYLRALAGGAVAAGRFLPPAPPASGSEASEQSRSRALAGWQRAADSLEMVVGTWSESALDKYRLPHPVLGKMSVREMLFFTHYHDTRHLETVRRVV